MTSPASQAISAGLRGKCPACREGSVFDGYLKFARDCPACGFNFSENDVADGPAVFVILIASVLVLPLTIALQLKYDPPLLLTFAISLPLITLICLALLRPLRGLMFNVQVHNKAQDGRLVLERQTGKETELDNENGH